MSDVTIELPMMLRELVGIASPLRVEAASLGEALDAVRRQHPAIGLHLFDENGNLRRHLLCFYNDEFIRDAPDTPVSSGDRVLIVHKVSGG